MAAMVKARMRYNAMRDVQRLATIPEYAALLPAYGPRALRQTNRQSARLAFMCSTERTEELLQFDANWPRPA